MTEQHIAHIKEQTGISEKQIRQVAKLLGEGATIPFIARYRKEQPVPWTRCNY
jgi:uncharacterized protein